MCSLLISTLRERNTEITIKREKWKRYFETNERNTLNRCTLDEKISQALHAYIFNEYRVNVAKEFTRIPVTSEWMDNDDKR